MKDFKLVHIPQSKISPGAELKRLVGYIHIWFRFCSEWAAVISENGQRGSLAWRRQNCPTAHRMECYNEFAISNAGLLE